MAKKLKSQRQIYALELYFRQRPDKWPKQELINLSKQTGLTRSQVYKWLWDKRNQIRFLEKTREKPQCKDYFGEYQSGMLQNQERRSSFAKKYRKITIKSQFQEIVLSVPQQIQFCHQIMVSCHTSRWAISMLKKHGYELTKLNSETQYSQEKPMFVSEFKEVKEEAYSNRK